MLKVSEEEGLLTPLNGGKKTGMKSRVLEKAWGAANPNRFDKLRTSWRKSRPKRRHAQFLNRKKKLKTWGQILLGTKQARSGEASCSNKRPRRSRLDCWLIRLNSSFNVAWSESRASGTTDQEKK